MTLLLVKPNKVMPLKELADELNKINEDKRLYAEYYARGQHRIHFDLSDYAIWITTWSRGYSVRLQTLGKPNVKTKIVDVDENFKPEMVLEAVKELVGYLKWYHEKWYEKHYGKQ